MSSEVADLYITLRTKAEPLLAGFEEAGTKGESFIKRMGGVTGALSKLGGATVAASVGVTIASVKMAGDFQQQTNVLVTAAGETAANLGKVRTGILQIARDTGTSWQQLTEGMYEAEKAGFNFAKGGLDVVKVAAQGAREEGAPLNDVVDAMTTVMNNYHIPASKAVNVMNALKTAAGEAKTNFGLFSSSLSTVLPAAYAAHISLADVAGSIAVMTQRGETAQHATQLYAATIRGLMSPNAQAVSTLNQLGLTSQQVAKDMGTKGLSGTLDEIVNAIQKKMGPSGLYAVGVFKQSAQYAQSANTMLAKMPATIQGTSKAFLDGTVSVQDWRKYVKSLPADQAAMAQQFGALVLKSKGFSDGLKAGNGPLTTFNDLLRKATGNQSGMQTALLLTGNKGKDTATSIGKVNKSLNDGSKDVEGWGSTSQLFNVQLAKLKQSGEALAIQWGSKLIPVITSGVQWFTKHTTAAKVFAGIIAGILTLAVLTWSGKTALSMIKSIRDIGGALGAGGKAIKGFVSAGGGLDTIRLRAMQAGGGIKSMGSTAKNLTTSGISKLGTALSSVASGAKTAGIWIADMSKKLVVQTAMLVKNVAIWVAEKTATLAAAAASKVAAAAQWLLDLAMDANPLGLVVLAIVALIAAFVLLYTKCKWFRDFIQADFKAVQVVGKWIWDDGLKPAFDGIVAGAKWVYEQVIKRWWKAITTEIKVAVDYIKGVIQIWSDIFHGKWGKVWSDAKAMLAKVWHDIQGLLPGWLSKAVNTIIGWFKNSGKWLYNAGWNIMVGLWNGISGMVGRLYNYVSGIAKNISKSFTNVLSIFSPSRVFASHGANIAKGLIVGMQGMAGQVSAQAKGLAAATMGGFGSPTLSVTTGGAPAGSGSLAVNTAALAVQAPAAATASTALAGTQQPVILQVDGQKLFQFIVTMAQQHGMRNRSTNLQFGGALA